MFVPEFPYDVSALEPALSRATVMHHFYQEHCAHYERLAALTRDTELDRYSLDELQLLCEDRPGCGRLKTHVGAAWNHELYWNSLRPGGGGRPGGAIAGCIRGSFGNYPNFARRLKAAAAAFSGSGWLWVTWRAGRIEILTTANANSPLADGHAALLAMDLWEHAYYLDYLGARSAYVRAWLKELINWDFANERLRAIGRFSQPPIPRNRQPQATIPGGIASPAAAAANAEHEAPMAIRNVVRFH